MRDIEASPSANATKVYAMGFRFAVRCSTLADANESRDWRIWTDPAALLIGKARKLYADEPLAVELTNTVYALDCTTIDLSLSLFERAPFRWTKAAIKAHTLFDLRVSIPTFIHISDGKLHDVNALGLPRTHLRSQDTAIEHRHRTPPSTCRHRHAGHHLEFGSPHVVPLTKLLGRNAQCEIGGRPRRRSGCGEHRRQGRRRLAGRHRERMTGLLDGGL